MSTAKKVPVVILNGFLGSGKTTLFRSLLAQSKKNNISICGIVNDMSELDVDGELLGNSAIVEEDERILESIHSCVLSSKVGLQKLDESLKRLLKHQNPELIIIETSGSGHPMPLIEYFKTHDQAVLTGVFVLVDSTVMADDFNFGERLIPTMQKNAADGKRDTVNLLVEQILFCSHLILTKADRIEQERLPDIATYVQQLNSYASTHSVQFGRLKIESLFELPEYNYQRVAQLIDELKPVLKAEEEGDRPYNLATRVIKDDRPFHPQRLWDTCHKYLDKRIYRSKGFFWLATRDKHALLWNQAAGGINLELIGSWRAGVVEDENHGLMDIEIKGLKKMLEKETGRFGDRHCDLTVIGDKSQVDRFTEALKSCLLTKDEIEQYKFGHAFDDPWPQKLVRMQV